jgi:hypothetical protein
MILQRFLYLATKKPDSFAMNLRKNRAHSTPYPTGGLQAFAYDPLCYGTLSSGDQLCLGLPAILNLSKTAEQS